MAERPIFIPNLEGPRHLLGKPVEFTWHAGMSKVQKQKSIRSLHNAAKDSLGIDKILEISSKSEDALGVSLSAFNLLLRSPHCASKVSVEVLFQGSKVFTSGGPYLDLYETSSRAAKKDTRLKNSGDLRSFRYGDFDWPLKPQTAFYDWLYVSALHGNQPLAVELLKYDGFSDIEFNPKKSINCQASSAALYKTLVEKDLIDLAMSTPVAFIKVHEEQRAESVPIQPGLF
jgi:hypothetical protein